LSVVLPDVVVDCMFKTIPWTALTSSMWSCWERALSSASVTAPPPVTFQQQFEFYSLQN
jgi:hypothetical protein